MREKPNLIKLTNNRMGVRAKGGMNRIEPLN
jgi:hypothetical protein